MLHLPTERLAALVDEEPSSVEAEHLDTGRARDERRERCGVRAMELTDDLRPSRPRAERPAALHR